MFLQAVDTVLAFSMIMLLLSVLVTVLVQMFISLFGLRGQNLVFGLQQLVGAVAPELDQNEVGALVQKVFHHPALRAGAKRTSVHVDAKEVLMVLDSVRKAADLEPKIKASLDTLFESAASESSKLAASLDGLEVLRTALPEDIEAVQKASDQALDGAKEIVVRIDTWFDSAMRHASERLKLHARWITGFCAVVLALGLQVDTITILNELWVDPEVTTQFVLDAQGAMDIYEESQKLVNVQAEATGTSSVSGQATGDPKDLVNQIRATLGDSDLTVFSALSKKGWVWSPALVSGSLISALLLSLGAPFWYGVVGKLVGFRRSAAAGKTKQQKA